MIKTLEDLIESFQRLPGVGQKTAERYALTVLDLPKETVEQFAQCLIDSKEKIQICSECGHLSEDEKCEVCSNPARDTSTICVVQSSKDVYAIEKTGMYDGLYHVLGGVISTTKGILPEDLNLMSLLDRLDQVQEVILALSLTMDGETTALYLERLLKDRVKVTRLAQGLPMNAQLDYADELTLIKAFTGRK